jgi:hypothetical protein
MRVCLGLEQITSPSATAVPRGDPTINLGGTLDPGHP